MKQAESTWVHLWRWAAPVVLMLAFLYLSSILIVHSGFGGAALMIVPIGLIAWQYGRWAGLLAGAITSTGLFEFVVFLGGDTSNFFARGFGPGFLALSALGFLVGYASQQLLTSRRAVRVAELARDLMELVAADLPLDQTLNELTERVEKNLVGARCSILLLDRETGVLNHASAPNLPISFYQAIDGVTMGPEVGSCGTSAFLNETVVTVDIQQDSRWADFAELAARYRLAACWSMPITSANNEVLGTFATYYDQPGSPEPWELDIVGKAVANGRITLSRHQDKQRQKQLEEQIQTAQKLEGLGLLAGGIAHDFNNMLAIVLGNAELLALDTSDAGLLRRTAAITDAATRAADLAKQMLVYAGKAHQQLVEVELSTLVSELQSLATAGMSKTIRLDLDLAENLPTLTADETQLRQVIMNLLVNAAEAIGDNAVGTISVRTSREYVSRETLDQSLLGKDLAAGEYIRLEVEDDGEGISEDVKKHIFDPFFSTKFTGRGLGLAVIFGVVMHHKGSISLESKVGKGSCFTIRLPVPSQKAKPTVVDSMKSLTSVGSGIALIIDDEESVREVASDYLLKLGFEVVHQATGGLEGIKAFNRLAESLSLVLIDLTMPDISGHEVLKKIETQKSSAHMVLMTGYDAAKVREESSASLNAILNKPFNLASLSNAISESERLH